MTSLDFFSKSRKLKDFPTDFHKNIIMMKKHARQGFEHHYKNVCFRLKIIALFFSESCSGLGECEHVLQVFAPANTITPGLGGVLGQTTSPWAGPAHGWAGLGSNPHTKAPGAAV